MKDTQEDIFWSYVNRDSDGCWPWTKSLFPTGYGQFHFKTPDGKVIRRAHRVAYYLAHGSFDTTLNVLHMCDNPPCCNPAHLFLGTPRDNVSDMLRKRRGNTSIRARCETHPQAKLTLDDVRTIRHLYFAERRTLREIGDYFAVSLSNIHNIVRRKTWNTSNLF